MRIVLTLVFLLLLISLFPIQVQSQGSPNPNIDIECPDEVELVDIFADNATSTFQCTLTNPTNYEENVSIQINSGGMLSAAPSSISVAPLGEEEFNISIMPDSRMIRTVHLLSVTATVTDANGVANPTPTPKTENIELSLGFYSDNGCFTSGSSNQTHVRLEVSLNNSSTNTENIDIELNYSLAPMHSENFALLAEMGCYDGTIFHRVVDNFMIQGGDIDQEDGEGGHAAKWFGYCMPVPIFIEPSECPDPSNWSVPAEFGGIHSAYVLSMARFSNNNSAGSQFFITESEASQLDGLYTVFGRAISGQSTVDKISEVECPSADGICRDGYQDSNKTSMPIVSVVIVRATIFQLNDSDGDGVNDEDDAFPDDENESSDSDGDGVGDNSDAFPNDENESSDSDGDGVGDNSDAFPNDENESVDSDGDGVGNNSDAFPEDENETLDSDGDGVGDNADVKPDDPTIATDEDLKGQEGIEASLLWAIVGAMIFLGVCLLILTISLRKKKDKNSPYDVTDSMWDDTPH